MLDRLLLSKESSGNSHAPMPAAPCMYPVLGHQELRLKAMLRLNPPHSVAFTRGPGEQVKGHAPGEAQSHTDAVINCQ